jgi:two-component system, OmpR family, sensor histidine kinase MtrB
MVSLLRPFRRSLFLRVFTVTSLISTALIYSLGSNLESRIERGIISEKESSSISEAKSVIQFATYKLTIGTLTSQRDLTAVVDEIVNSTDVGAEESGREIVLINYDGRAVEGIPTSIASNGFNSASITAELRNRVRTSTNLQSERGPLSYLDGRSVDGILVGKRLSIPRIGLYEMYVAYSFEAQYSTIDLIRSSIVVSGFLFVILILVIALVVLRRVIKPVQDAADIAEKLTSGELDKRIDVHGEDELARLGIAFNEMASTLSNQIARLENLSKVQQRFVSDVSHELRTPLTTIRMAADVIHSARDQFDPAVARSAELLISQIERFEALLADLLEVSRLDAKVANVAIAKVEIVSLVRRCIEDLSNVARERGIEVRLHSLESEIQIDGDQLRLERIMRNLLTNAIDHSEGKSVDVMILANENDLSIGVRDYGVGLSEQQIPRVFDRFWRADPSRSRIRGGTGLGLSIAQEDAALHGGEIKVWGRLGAGTNFVLTLPLHSGDHIRSHPISEIPTTSD